MAFFPQLNYMYIDARFVEHIIFFYKTNHIIQNSRFWTTVEYQRHMAFILVSIQVLRSDDSV